MRRLVHTIALAAGLLAILISLWGGYGLLVTLRRAVISYLGFFIVASLLVLIYRLGVTGESRVDGGREHGASRATSTGVPDRAAPKS